MHIIQGAVKLFRNANGDVDDVAILTKVTIQGSVLTVSLTVSGFTYGRQFSFCTNTTNTTHCKCHVSK